MLSTEQAVEIRSALNIVHNSIYLLKEAIKDGDYASYGTGAGIDDVAEFDKCEYPLYKPVEDIISEFDEFIVSMKKDMLAYVKDQHRIEILDTIDKVIGGQVI